MTAELNELLDQATQRSDALAEHVDVADQEVEQVLKGATALSDLALKHAEELHQDFTEALEAVESAREDVHVEAARTDAALDGLPARTDASETEARTLQADVARDTAALQELRTRLATRADESAQDVNDGVRTLQGRVEALHQSLDGRLDLLDLEVEALLGTVEKGQARIEEEEQHVREAVQSLGVMATDQAHAFAAALRAVLLLVGRNVVEVCNNVLKSHNGALKTLRTGLTGEEPGGGGGDESWVRDAVEPLRVAVAELALVPEPARQVLEEVGGIVKAATDAAEDLVHLAQALENAVPAVQGA